MRLTRREFIAASAAAALNPIEKLRAAGGVSISTVNYNPQRTNANLSETIFTPTNVGGIKKLGTYSVDEKPYGQPLVIDGVNISGTIYRLLIVATMNNTIYAFDATRPGSAAIWSVHTGAPLTTYPAFSDGFLYGGPMGILSTPVVDMATKVVYFVSQLNTGIWVYALNLSDGSSFHAPGLVTGTSSASGSPITFDPVRHLQRTGLLLFSGSLYFACAGYGDQDPYQGWIFRVSATTLAVQNAYVDAPVKGGIWMSGAGISTDGTDILIAVGTGEGVDNGTTNLAECFIRMSPSLVLLDYMLRSDWEAADLADDELGSTQAMVVGTRVMGGSKDGYFWVMNIDAMGNLEGSGPPVVQRWQPKPKPSSYGIWNAAYGNGNLYLLGLLSTISRYTDTGTTFTTTPAATSAGSYGAPDGGIVYTSNGSAAGTGLLWVVSNQGFAFHDLVAGKLQALDATTLAVKYDSDTVVGDALGSLAKFAVPTIANGRVFVPTFSNTIVVYGFGSPGSMQLTGGMSVSGGFEIH